MNNEALSRKIGAIKHLLRKNNLSGLEEYFEANPPTAFDLFGLVAFYITYRIDRIKEIEPIIENYWKKVYSDFEAIVEMLVDGVFQRSSLGTWWDWWLEPAEYGTFLLNEITSILQGYLWYLSWFFRQEVDVTDLPTPKAMGKSGEKFIQEFENLIKRLSLSEKIVSSMKEYITETIKQKKKQLQSSFEKAQVNKEKVAKITDQIQSGYEEILNRVTEPNLLIVSEDSNEIRDYLKINPILNIPKEAVIDDPRKLGLTPVRYYVKSVGESIGRGVLSYIFSRFREEKKQDLTYSELLGTIYKTETTVLVSSKLFTQLSSDLRNRERLPSSNQSLLYFNILDKNEVIFVPPSTQLGVLYLKQGLKFTKSDETHIHPDTGELTVQVGIDIEFSFEKTPNITMYILIEDSIIIAEIEKQLEISIPQVSKLLATVGYVIKDQRITELNLNKTELQMFPETIGNLTNLRILDLSSNQLASLPETLGNLSNLEYLNLELNRLASLPASFGNLSKLKTLWLDKNQLASLPASFGNLTRLERLHLFNNNLTSLPASFGNLSNLEFLHLGRNQLASLPASFGNLSKLKTLWLNNNQLASLPASLGQLTNLQTLILESNQLSSLPASFGKLVNLKELYLNENELTSLPETFGNLQSLQTLHLWDNKLTSLPASLKEFFKKMQEKGYVIRK